MNLALSACTPKGMHVADLVVLNIILFFLRHGKIDPVKSASWASPAA